MRRDARLLLMPLVVAALAAQNQTTVGQAYQEGLTAQRQGDHATAVLALQRALQLHPQSSPRLLTYGNNFTSYYPQVHLAEALLALGRLDEAGRALEASLRTKVEPAELQEAVAQKLKERRQARAAAAAPVPAPAAGPATVPLEALGAPREAPRSAEGPKAEPAPAKSTVAAPAEKPPAPALRSAAPATPGNAGGSLPVQAQPQPGPAAPPPALAATPVAAPVTRWLIPASAVGLVAILGALALRFRRRPNRPPDHPTVAITLSNAGQLTALEHNLPATLGPYTLDRVLGRGSFAITYAGHRASDRLPVAVKVPHPHIFKDVEAMNRFRQEALLGALLDHPAIVRLAGPAPASGLPWMAMELVQGETLQEYLARNGRLRIPEALQLGLEIAQALAHAHGQGVVHRDLKPANVMVSQGHAKVMDFGIARVLDAIGLTATVSFLGTPAYAAPESLKGSRVGPPADRYALGLIIFEMLAGQPPFQADHPLALMEMHRTLALPDLAGLRPEAPPRLIRLVERLAAKNPEERPEDPEVLMILTALVNG